MTPAIESVHAIQSAAIKRFWKNHYEGNRAMTPAIEKAKAARAQLEMAADILRNPLSSPLEVGFRHSALAPKEREKRYADGCQVALSLVEAADKILAALEAESAGDGWRPIESAPKGKYIEITDGVCVQDTVAWQSTRPPRMIDGCIRLSVPEGWFAINGGRSRLDGKAKFWKELTPLPQPPRAGED